MRTRHTAHPAFPVYAATFVSNDLLVLAGGGGFGKTGVNNRVVRNVHLLLRRTTRSLPRV